MLLLLFYEQVFVRLVLNGQIVQSRLFLQQQLLSFIQ